MILLPLNGFSMWLSLGWLLGSKKGGGRRQNLQGPKVAMKLGEMKGEAFKHIHLALLSLSQQQVRQAKARDK